MGPSNSVVCLVLTKTDPGMGVGGCSGKAGGGLQMRRISLAASGVASSGGKRWKEDLRQKRTFTILVGGVSWSWAVAGTKCRGTGLVQTHRTWCGQVMEEPGENPAGSTASWTQLNTDFHGPCARAASGPRVGHTPQSCAGIWVLGEGRLKPCVL